jgi:hypothetical protein
MRNAHEFQLSWRSAVGSACRPQLTNSNRSKRANPIPGETMADFSIVFAVCRPQLTRQVEDLTERDGHRVKDDLNKSNNVGLLKILSAARASAH